MFPLPRVNVQFVVSNCWLTRRLERTMEGTRAPKILITPEECVTKVGKIRDTVTSLEDSLTISWSLEAERWLKYSTLKTKNKATTNDLRKANKRNKSMLSTFGHFYEARNYRNATDDRIRESFVKIVLSLQYLLIFYRSISAERHGHSFRQRDRVTGILEEGSAENLAPEV